MSRKPRLGAQRLRDRKTRNRVRNSQLHIETLDARVLLDASDALVAGFRADSTVAPPHDDSAPLFAVSKADASTPSDSSNPAAAGVKRLGLVGIDSLRTEVVFVDEGVTLSEQMTKDLLASRPGIVRHVIAVSAADNGLNQIADALRSFDSVDAIHIVSHGDDAQLRLGDSSITGDQLENQYADALREIGSHLNENADVLIYGCDLASSSAGRDFVSSFSQLTGADVAASDDATGPQSLGGDWTLEVTTGAIESSLDLTASSRNSLPETLGLTGFNAGIGSDGTPTWDVADTPGNDTGPSNGRVRAHDIVTFDVDLGVNSSGITNPHITSTLPFGLVWDNVPAIATGADSGIFDSVTGLPGGDMRTIVLHLADITSSLSTSIQVQAAALGVQDGTAANGVTFEITADEVATPVVSSPMNVTITSAPFMDIRMGRPYFNGIWPNATGTEDGAVFTYEISVLGRHPTRTGADSFKGSAPIQDDFTFDLDLSGVSPSASIYSWGPNQSGTYYGSDDGIRRNFEVQGGQWGWGLYWRPSGKIEDGGSTHSYHSEPNSTPDSGDFNVTTPGTPGGTYGVTVSGADTDGPLPKYQAAGNSDTGHRPLPASEGVFVSGVVDVWIPISDIDVGGDGIAGTPDDGSLVVAPRVDNFDPDDLWHDQNNYGADSENTSNNSYSHTVLSFSMGGPTKALYEYGRWTWEQTQSYYRTGDGKTSSGHQYDVGLSSGQNLGVLPVGEIILGDKIDNTSTIIAPNSPYLSTPMISGNNWSRVYQSRGSGPTANSWLTYGTHYIIEFGTGGVGGAAGGWTDWDSMGDATVADSESPVWTQDPADPALGGTIVKGVSDAITKYRIKMLIDLEPGAYLTAWVTHETVSRSTLDLSADPTGDLIADQMAAINEIRLNDPLDPSDDVWYTSNYDPLTNSWYADGAAIDIYRGDRLRYVDAQVRIDKEVVDTGTGTNFLGGSIATFQLDGTVTIPGPDNGVPASDVMVVDILPGGLTVVPGGVSPTSTNGNPVEYCIVCDGSDWTNFYPSNGLATGVRWIYGDVPLNTTLPTMTVDVLMPFDAPSGTQYENSVVISSSSDPSPEEDRDAFAGLTVVQLAALSVSKTPITPIVPENSTIVYELGVANVSDDKVIPFIDVTDILPWNGDEDGSSFNGNFTNIATSMLPPGLEIYVSTASPTVLDSQDGSVDGFADPGTSSSAWYEAPGTVPGGQWEYTLADVIAGAAGAPSMSTITALRAISDPASVPYLDTGESVTWRLELTPSGNEGVPSDRYVNDILVRTDPSVLTEPTTSGLAEIVVVAPQIDITKEICLYEFGPCDATNDAHWIADGIYKDDPSPTWRIRVENTGTADLPTVTVTDPSMPTGMNLVAASVSATGGDASGFDPTWTLSLVAGDVQYLTFDTELTVIPNVTAFENQVSVVAEDQFGQTVTDSDDASITYTPEVGVSKYQAAVTRNSTNSDLFDLTYRVTIENTGLVVLDKLELTEDLNAAFGAGFVGVATAPTIVASSLSSGASLPLTNPAWNGDLAGTGDAEVFDGNSGILGGGDNVTIEYTITVDPTLLPDPGNETNQVVASANDGTTTDHSDDGIDPDGTNPTYPGDNGAGGKDDPTPLVLPDVRIAKQVEGTYVENSDGTWTIPYQLVMENTGTVALTNLSMTDNISSQLGATVFNRVTNVAIDNSGVVNGTGAALAGTWDGTDASNILDGTGSLEPEDTVVVTFNLVVNGSALAGNSPLTNQANAGGDDPEGNPVDDLSDDGPDPSTSNAGSPGDNGTTDDPTPILIPDIGIAKEVVGTPVKLTNGNWSVQYQLVLQNTGTVDLTNLQITEDLEDKFGVGVYVGLTTAPTIVSGPSLAGSASPVLDALWDGGLSASGNVNLFNGMSGTLVPNDSVSIRFTVEVNPDVTGTAKTLNNQATATGEDPNGTSTTDSSDSGSDPNSTNPTGPGDTGGPNDPTPLILPDVAIAKEVHGPYVNNGDGTWTIPYQIILENIGSADLTAPAITDNIQTQLGAAVFSRVANVALDTSGVVGGTAPALSGTWTGDSTVNILDGSGTLSAGDAVTVTFDVIVNGTALAANSPLTNQAVGAGTGPDGPITDLSDDGDNPNSDNPTSPGDNGAGGMNDPTPIQIPQVGLAKQVVGSPTRLADGSFSVTYELVLQNTGTVDLTNFQISEDLEDEFGVGRFVGLITSPTITSGPNAVGSTAPNLNAAWNGGLAGSSNTDLLNGTSGRLVPNDSITIRFTVKVDPDATGTSSALENTAVASGQDPNGTTVSDDSDSGADANNDEDDATPLLIPDVRLAKQVDGPYVDNNNGTFTIPYRLVLENVGTVDLTNPSITDNIQDQLSVAVFNSVANVAIDTTGVVGGTAPSIGGSWTGTSGANILDGSGLLEPGDQVSVTFDLIVNETALASNSPLENQATGAGTGPSGVATDLSDDGDNPNSDNPDAPGDDGAGGTNDPTPILLPNIGLAKNIVSGPTKMPNGNWMVGYQLTVQNTGTVDLVNLQVSENLEVEFGTGVYVGVLSAPTISSAPSLPGSSLPVLDSGWDGGLGGSADSDIFNGSSGRLVPNDSIAILFQVEVNPDANGASSELTNQAEASGQTTDGTTATDVSDDGTNPNGTNPGEDGDTGTPDDPTPLRIPEIGVTKQANNVTEVATGVYDVQYVIVVENTGTVDLFNLQVTEDLASEFGSGFLSVQSPPAITGSTATSDPTLATWNGNTAADFFDGSSGELKPSESLTLQFTVRVDTTQPDTTPPEDYTNQVNASGEDATGTVVTDLSDNGTNPNTDNGAGTTDDRTPFEVPQIRAVKSYGTITENSDGTYRVPVAIVVQNTGTVDLTDLSLTEDIADEFGNAFIRVANPQISPVGTYGGVLPQFNPAWTSDTSVDVISLSQLNESLLAGETYQFTFDVIVDPDGVDDQAQALMNQAKVAGTGENFDGSPTMVMDESGYPTALNPDGSDSDNPAVLLIPEIRTAKVVTDVVANGTNWDVTFNIVLENTGTTDLTGVDLFDDLTSQMGAKFVEVVNVTIDDTTGIGVSTAPTLNYGTSAGTTPFDGGASGPGSDNLLNNDGNLVPGEWLSITLTITIDPDATGVASGIMNQATAAGDGPTGEVTDQSDDGANPNGSNPDSPSDTGGHNDPTPVELPDISITKEVSGTPTQLGNGNFSVPYRLVLENTGTVDLINLQITEDLEDEFGAGVFVGVITPPAITNGPSLIGSVAPARATWDGGLGGSSRTELFNDSSGRLVPGDFMEIEFTVEIDPDALGTSQPLDNQVQASGTGLDAAGTPIGTVTDDSDSGTNPNSTNPGAPGDTGSSEDPTPLALPDIGTTKEVSGPYVNNGDGTWTIPFEMVLENTGTVDLTNPNWVDNVQSQLTASVFAGVSNVVLDTSNVTNGTAPGLNSTWNGTTNGNILDGSGSLAPGDSISVTFEVMVNERAFADNSPLSNQANVSATGPQGPVTDLSDDGNDPHGDNPTAPGDNGSGGTDDPTPIQIPRVGLAKQVVGTPTQLANGNYAVAYELVLVNLGTVDLVNLQIQEDLETEFGTDVFVRVITPPSIVNGPTDAGSRAPTLATWSGGLGGASTTNIFNGTTGILTPNDSVTVAFTVEVDPDVSGSSTPLENTAQATAEDNNGATVSDESDNGTDPNDDTDTPTPLEIPEIRTVKQVSGPYVENSDGTFTIPYELSVENTGTSDLANVSLTDNVQNQIGAAAFESISNVQIDVTSVVSGTAPGLNSSWNGTSNANILDGSGTLAPGDSVTVTFDLLVDGSALAANSPLTNQSTASGDGPSGTATDLSDDGTDPHGTNPTAPGDQGTADDPTPIQISNVGLSKRVLGSPTKLPTGNYSVTYELVLQNTGTVDLKDLQIVEDLEAEFGADQFVGVLSSPSISSAPSETGSTAPVLAAWDGGHDGSANVELFNGTTGVLVPNDSVSVQFTIEVDPDASGKSTPLDNTAEASAVDPNGMSITDDSDSGADPNGTNPGEPGDTGSPDDATPLEIPEISTVKMVSGDYVENGDGTFTIPYELTFENIGTSEVSNLRWRDNIESQVGSAAFDRVENIVLDTSDVTDGTAPGINSSWDATDNANILDGTGSLSPGDSITLTFDLVVQGSALASSSPLTNQTNASADGPDGVVTDRSDDGDDPHGSNPDSPGDTGTTDDPTPIQIPDVALAKSLVGTPVKLANGNYEVTYRLVLQNTGTVDLTNLQIEEDLEDEFGNGVFVGVLTAPSITHGPSESGSTPPSITSWSGGLNGASSTYLFDGTTGLLVPNDSVTVVFSVEVDPDATGTSTELLNQAVATATDGDGNSVTDDSDSGSNPNSSNPGEPGDRLTPDDATPLEIPEVSTVKKVNGAYTDNNDGTYTIPYTISLENTGTVSLTDVTWKDDIQSQLGTAVFVGVRDVTLDTSNVTLGTAPGLSSTWTGADGSNILDGTGQLAPGDSITVQFNLIVNERELASNSPLSNQVEASGIGPNDGTATDLSDDGDDPNGSNPDAPGDMGTTDDPTPILIPNVGLAKHVFGDPIQLPNGNFSVTYELVLQNVGTVNLQNLQITEDLEDEFGAGVFVDVLAPPTIFSGPNATGSTAPALSDWDGGLAGSSEVELFNGTSGFLVPNDSITVRFTIEVDPDATGAASTLANQADATAEDENGTEVTDPSDSGSNPNSVNTGEPGDTGSTDDPTPLTFADISTVKNVVALVPNGDNWDLTFDLVVENTGTATLNGIRLVDDLASQLGPQLVSVLNVTMDTSNVSTGSPPTLNFGASAGAVPFDGGVSGGQSDSLLNGDGSLDPGDSVTLQMTITVDPDASGASTEMSNQTTASGQDDNGTRVTDISDDGTDPNGTNTGSPGDKGTSDDPTPIAIPDIGISKEVATKPTQLANGNFSVTYRLVVENIGSVDLTNLQLVDDLENELGVDVFVGVLEAPTISTRPSDPASIAPTVSSSFDGGLANSSNTDVFNGTSGLLVPGDFIEVEFTIEVNPNAVGPGTPIENQATAVGDDPDGTSVDDLSDDGDDPNGTNPTATGDTGGSNDPTPLDLSDIGLAKEVVGSPDPAPTAGNFHVTYRMVVENTGNTTLTGLDLYDDVSDKFGDAFVSVQSPPTIVGHTMANASNLPTINAGWASNTLRSILNDDGRLEPGETLTLEYVLELDSVAADGETLFNQAEIVADDPITGGEEGTSDLSDDGSDPDGENPRSPGDNGTSDDPTPVRLPLPTDATVEIDKTTISVDENVVTFTLEIENTGLAMADRITISDDLDAVFGAGNYEVNSTYMSTPPFDPTSSLALNLNFNGGAGTTAGVRNNDIVNHTINNMLAPGDRAIFEIVVTVNTIADQDGPGGLELGEFENHVVLSNRGPTGTTFTDDGSDDVEFEPNATVGVAKDSVWDDEEDTAIFNFYLEHFGNTEASNISFTENFDAIFGATNWSLVEAPVVVSGPRTLTTNPQFNGIDETELIGAGSTLLPGETAQVQVNIIVTQIDDVQGNGLGLFENQVTVETTDAADTTYTDTSIDGTDPDPNGDGDPNNDDSPSQGRLTPRATTGVGKVGSVSDDGLTATYDFHLKNYGNAVAENLTLMEDFNAVFGAGKYEVTAVELVSGPMTVQINDSFNGNTDTEMIAEASSIAPDETAQIRVTLALTDRFGLYENQAELSYDVGGTTVTEVSTTGADPDPDGDGDPRNNSEPTVVAVPTGEIHGFHYVDHDNDGIFDSNERAIPGVVVTLTGTDINGDSVEIVETTLSDGSYSFTGLLPGDYVITQTHPETFIDGQETVGNFGGTTENDIIYLSLINHGEFIAENYNFGELGLDPTALGKNPFLTSNVDASDLAQAEGAGEESQANNSGSDAGNDQGSDSQDPADPNNVVASGDSPLEFNGDQVTVHGTKDDDSIRVLANSESHRIIVNSIEYVVDANEISRIDVQGNGGSDTVEIRGTNGIDTLTFRSDLAATLIGQGYTINVEDAKAINAYGAGGQDSVNFTDSNRRDEFVVTPTFAQMSNTAFTHSARHFESVTATSTSASDRVTFYGSDGDDRVQMTPTESSMTSEGFAASTTGFTTVRAYAKEGNDTVVMNDSDGKNILAAHPHTTNLSGGGINFTANQFDAVVVETTGKGNDVAYLHGSDGNDQFIGRPNEGEMTGDGYNNRAVGFDQIIVLAHGGTQDQATIYDSSGNDVVVFRPQTTNIRGANFKTTLRGFDDIAAHSVAGGTDAATFFDSKGDDEFVKTTNTGTMTGDGFRNSATGFSSVVAHSTAGGSDTAELHDSDEDDVFVSRNGKAVMRNSTNKTIVNKFENVRATSTEGDDSATFLDVTRNETMAGAGETAHVYGDRDHRTDGFARVIAKAKGTQKPNSEVDNVDFLFSQFGDWG